jgi:hypothetical protein
MRHSNFAFLNLPRLFSAMESMPCSLFEYLQRREGDVGVKATWLYRALMSPAVQTRLADIDAIARC